MLIEFDFFFSWKTFPFGYYIIYIIINNKILIFNLYVSGKYHDRISLLDDWIKRCLNSINITTGLRYFNDMYKYVYRHFTKILCEFNCPESMLITVRNTCTEEKFKNIIQFYVIEQVKHHINLTHCDISTNSDTSEGSYSDSSQTNGEET